MRGVPKSFHAERKDTYTAVPSTAPRSRAGFCERPGRTEQLDREAKVAAAFRATRADGCFPGHCACIATPKREGTPA